MHIGIGWSFVFLEGVKSPFVMSHRIETVPGFTDWSPSCEADSCPGILGLLS